MCDQSLFAPERARLRQRVRQAERDAGVRGGLTPDERQRLKDLELDRRAK